MILAKLTSKRIVRPSAVVSIIRRKRERRRRSLHELRTDNCVQYLGILVSIRSAQAVIPPVRLLTLAKPACFKKATAFALRPPILQ